MAKIEWGQTTHENEKGLIIDSRNQDHSPNNVIDYSDLLELGVDGYVDGNSAIKITDPSLSKLTSPKFRQHTLVQGDEKSMSDKTDERYSELKEDLRDSERRIASDFKERENRFERELVRREERFEKSLEKFAEDAKEREERYLKSVDEIKQIVADGERNRKSNTIAMWTLAVTTIIGIAAMVVTVVVSG